MSSLVAFVIGAGANVGKSVATALKEKGYSVAFGSRNPDSESVEAAGFLPVKIDAEKSDSIKDAFHKVTQKLGAPNVVIYNAASFIPPPVASDPLSLPLRDFEHATAIGVGVFTAAQEALVGFRSEKYKHSPRTFIVTGNILPFVPPSSLALSIGSQKAIEARLIATFAKAYSEEGIHFYFASLVSPTGGFPGSDFPKSGATHAQVYWDLISGKEQGSWDHRFTLDGKTFPTSN